MNYKKMATVIAFATLAMVIWVTIKVWFIHDPDNFFEIDARPHMVAWMMDHCKSYQCDYSAGGDGTPIKAAGEADEGWLYVIGTKGDPKEIVLLIPRENPRDKHLVQVREDAEGNLNIVDNGVTDEEKRRSRSARSGWSEMKGRTQGKYIAGAIAAALLVVLWFYKKRKPEALESKMGADPELARAAVVIGSRIADAPPGSASAAAAKEADPMQQLGRQYQACMASGDRAKGVELAPGYIGSLLKARQAPDAAKVFKECLAVNPGFALPEAAHVLPVAKAALASGDTQSAVAAVRGFDKKYPGHELIPEVYVFSARLMRDNLGNLDMAKKLLEHVIARYPGHFIAQDAKRELQAIA